MILKIQTGVGGGHTIIDSGGNTLATRSKLQFSQSNSATGVTVADNEQFDLTIVTIPNQGSGSGVDFEDSLANNVILAKKSDTEIDAATGDEIVTAIGSSMDDEINTLVVAQLEDDDNLASNTKSGTISANTFVEIHASELSLEEEVANVHHEDVTLTFF